MKEFVMISIIYLSLGSFASSQSFPEAWLGNYDGKMYIFRAGSETSDSLDVKFTLEEIVSNAEYSYIMTYDSEKFGVITKDYILRVDSSAHSYVLDEKDGILIDMSYMDDSFYSSFTVAGSVLNSVMRKTDEGIWFEISSSRDDKIRTTKNQAKEGDQEFIVNSYNPFTVQRVILYKQK